ncbi:ABC transporter substrate-binding protein [Limnohabitans sp. Hippo4]|uniref:ABC transporter substrate-binding protein n=1 Tax=Limnohabitans sp. Hippo4 TaxID=1826167 RepID=UPI001E39DAF3|nr:ABC transporter substrate-binding protein [Limnohabitans sp. Hippo4]
MNISSFQALWVASRHFGVQCLIQVMCGLIAMGSASVALAETSRLDKVLQAKELRACIWPEYYSITYRNPKTRELSGIDIALTQELAKELGVKVRYVDSNFSQLYDALEQDRCDVATHAIGITAERLARLQFSQAYLKSGLFAVTLKNKEGLQSWDSLDQPGRVIAVAAGTLMEGIMAKSLKKAKLVKVQAPGTREQEVLSGRADAFMTDYPYSLRMIELTDWAAVIPAPNNMPTTEYAYAFAKGDNSLLLRVEAFLSNVKKDGRLLQYAKQHNLDPIVVLK